MMDCFNDTFCTPSSPAQPHNLPAYSLPSHSPSILTPLTLSQHTHSPHTLPAYSLPSHSPSILTPLTLSQHTHSPHTLPAYSLPSHSHSLRIPTNSSCMKGSTTQRVSAIHVHPCSEQPCNFIQITTLDTLQEPSCLLCKDETRQQQYTMRATDWTTQQTQAKQSSE